MEESKELQKMYTLFRGCIYVSIILEIIVFVPFPFLKGVQFIIDPMSRWLIYDNLIYSKLATVLLVLITCIGTRAQKAIEFDARRMVVYPMIGGIVIIVLSVFSYNHILYLQPIITQYFIDNKSEIWLLFLIAHSKR